MISRELIELCREAVEELAAGQGCPTVLMELVDQLQAGVTASVPGGTGPLVLVRPRQAGKTSEIINWVCGGRPVSGWPGWSRVIVVPSAEVQKHLMQTWNHIVHPIVPGGLGKVVVTAGEFPGVRGMNPEVEVGYDNADLVFERALRRAPAVVTLTGQPVTHFPGPTFTRWT